MNAHFFIGPFYKLTLKVSPIIGEVAERSEVGGVNFEGFFADNNAAIYIEEKFLSPSV